MKKTIHPPASEIYQFLKLKRIQKAHTDVNKLTVKALLFLFVLIALLLEFFIIEAQTILAPNITLSNYCSGFISPTVIANCGDARLFVGEKNGYIYIIDAGRNKIPTPFLNIDNQVGSGGNEQGLLGLCFHPDYKNNGYFYVSFTDNSGHSKVKRFTRNATNPNLADIGSEVQIFSQNQPAPNHNGGCIQFGPDGYLYIGLGDGGNQGDPNGYGQNTQTLLGKMLRIDVNNGTPYTIPSSNPFVNNSNVLDEIWAIGLRNPWKWSFDRLTGDMWIGDVGEGTWEEVDYQPAGTGGRNYGWRCYEGNHPYNTNGCSPQSTYTSPVSEYQHNSTNGCSITGGYVYRGGKYGNLFGHYLVTDYCSGVIRAVTPNGTGGWITTNLGTFSPYQYSAFGEDYLGELYLAELGTGNIIKIKETSCLPTAFIKGTSSISICSADNMVLESIYGKGNSYQWQKNNVNVNGATGYKHTPATSGNYKVIVTNSAGCSNTSNVINVTVLNTPNATITANGPTTFCQGSSVVLSANTGSGLAYKWKKNGTYISGAVSSSYTASNTGTYKVEVTAANGCKRLSNGTGVLVNCRLEDRQDDAFAFDCIPNPSKGIFQVRFTSENEWPAVVEISDMIGKKIYTRHLLTVSGENKVEINLENTPKGIYFISLSGSGFRQIRKIMVD